jgi:hypothetical protein
VGGRLRVAALPYGTCLSLHNSSWPDLLPDNEGALLFYGRARKSLPGRFRNHGAEEVLCLLIIIVTRHLRDPAPPGKGPLQRVMC